MAAKKKKKTKTKKSGPSRGGRKPALTEPSANPHGDLVELLLAARERALEAGAEHGGSRRWSHIAAVLDALALGLHDDDETFERLARTAITIAMHRGWPDPHNGRPLRVALQSDHVTGLIELCKRSGRDGDPVAAALYLCRYRTLFGAPQRSASSIADAIRERWSKAEHTGQLGPRLSAERNAYAKARIAMLAYGAPAKRVDQLLQTK